MEYTDPTGRFVTDQKSLATYLVAQNEEIIHIDSTEQFRCRFFFAKDMETLEPMITAFKLDQKIQNYISAERYVGHRMKQSIQAKAFVCKGSAGGIG